MTLFFNPVNGLSPLVASRPYLAARQAATLFPGAAQHEAERSVAPRVRDRSRLGDWNDPGSAAHHQVALRCAREKFSTLPLTDPAASRAPCRPPPLRGTRGRR